MRTGALKIENNAFSGPSSAELDPDFITSLDGLRGLKYVGTLAVQENYHLCDLGGFVGPLVVDGASTLQRQPQCAACCPDKGPTWASTYLNCANTCFLKNLNDPGGFQEDNYSCSNPACQVNPYCTAPAGPQECTGCVGGTSGVCKTSAGVCSELLFGACATGTTPC